MAVPEGYVALGLVGFTDRGDYSEDGIYMQNDLVHRNNAIWKCNIDNTTGIEPAENDNWTIFVQSQTDLAGISATDTQGMVTGEGEVVVAQELLDAIADRVANKLLEKSKMSNVQVNDETMVPTSALVYAMQQAITNLNSNLTTRAMYVGYYLNNQWITILLKPNQTVLLTVNAFSQGNSVSNALYLIGGASGADKSGSILKLGGTFDLITNWNTGLSISINAAVDQWLQISALYL